MRDEPRDCTIINLLLVVTLLATLVFVILSCFMPSIVFPWIALAMGVVTLILGIIRYFEW